MKKLILILTLALLGFGCFAQLPPILRNSATTNTESKIVTQSGLAAGSYAINGAQLTNVFGESRLYGRSYKANEFPNFNGAIASNLPVRILTIGDSVSAANETAPGLRFALDRIGLVRGGVGSYYGDTFATGNDQLRFIQSGGLLFTAPDSHSANNHFHLTGGQIYTSATSDPILADNLTIYYFAQVGAGTMLVETQSLGGSWGTIKTIDSAVGTTSIATNITLTPRDYYNVRITSTGNNFLLNVGLNDTTIQSSHTWADASLSGVDTITLLTNAPFWQYLTNYNPHLIIVEAKDTAATMLETMKWFSANATNRDVIFVTPSPNSDDAGIPAEVDLMARYVRTNLNVSLFDKNSMFYPTNFWIPLTYSDGAHLNFRGAQRAQQAFADWFNVDSARNALGGKTNIQYFSPLDVRLVFAGSIQTTAPVFPNEIYYGGLNLLQPGYLMVSGAPRQIAICLPSDLVKGKINIAITQKWLTTNAQLIAHSAEIFRTSFDDPANREKIGTSGGNVLYAGTGTNYNTATRVLSTFTKPCRAGDVVYLSLGHGGTLTNSIWWMGCKVEAY
jgi:lysophospholipase L1-like esterase